MNKGMTGAIQIITLFSVISGLGLFALYLFVSSHLVMAQTQTTLSSNITLLAAGTNNITMANSANNNTEFYSNNPFGLNVTIENISTPSEIQFVQLVWYNVSGQPTFYNLTNDTSFENTSHRFFTNGSALTLGTLLDTTANRGQYRNATIRAWNNTNGVYQWLNDTTTTGFFNFSINERSPNATRIFPRANGIINATFYNTGRSINVTTNQTLSKVTAYINETISLVLTARLDNTEFGNSSQVSYNQTDFWVGWDNITYLGEDGFGNRSWSNFTARGYNQTFFFIDTISPTIDHFAAEIYNSTGPTALLQPGNYLRIIVNISDNSTDNATLQVWNLYDNTSSRYTMLFHNSSNFTTGIGNQTGIGAGELRSNTMSSWFKLNMSGENITRDGMFRFKIINVYDKAGNTANGTSNITYVFTNISATYHIPLVIYDNKTLSEIATTLPNITHVSTYDYREGFKNFTTFTVGSSTNANTLVNGSLNVTVIRINTSIAMSKFIRLYTEPPANAISQNISLEEGWSLFSFVTSIVLPYNGTMYSDVYINTSGTPGHTHTNLSVNLLNNTWVALNTTAPLLNISNITQIANTTNRLPASNFTFNRTHVFLNATGPQPFVNGTYNVTYEFNYSATFRNVTSIAIFNTSKNGFCAGIGFTLFTFATNTCGQNTSQLLIPAGYGIFILSDGENITLNRSNFRGDW